MTATATILQGRAIECEALATRIELATAGRGGAWLLRGAPGIGKSALLEFAHAAARERDVLVLRTAGSIPERRLAFAGLHHLMLPLIGIGAVELRTAFGLEPGQTPDLYRVALSTLDVLAEAATQRPVVLIVDDVQWLDAPTADVLTFVARRLAAEPIALLAAARDDTVSPLLGTGVPTLEVRPLDEQAAAALLDQHAAALPSEVRARVLADAAGNPLALVELPRAVAGADPALPTVLPLTERLERTFGGRIAELPALTRALLLLAAAEPACDLADLVRATQLATGTPCTPAAAAPAVAAGIAAPAATGLRFRHPLMASSVYQQSALAERVAAHTALAAILVDDPDRQAWHRASAALGPDEDVVDALVQSAERARRRGAAMASAAALARAAALTAIASRRDDLLLRAAEQATELGRRAHADELVAGIEPAELDAVGRARWLNVRALLDPGDLSDTARNAAITRAAAAIKDCEPELAVQMLWRVVSRYWWSSGPPEAREQVIAAIDAFGLSPDDPRRLVILAYADPVGRTALLERVTGLEPAPDDEPGLRLLGNAAFILGDFASGAERWRAADAILRRRGQLTLLVRNLIAGVFARAYTGDWERLEADVAEGIALAAETGEVFWEAAASAAAAHMLGARGDHEAAGRAAHIALTHPAVRGVRFVLFTAQLGLAYAAAAANRHREAYILLRQCFDPTSPVFHRDMRFWVLGDLAEFGLRAGTTEDARTLVAELTPQARATCSPRIRLSLAHAEALLAKDDVDEAFARALALDLSAWPVDHARVQLAYGMWLRRARRYSDCRVPLREAVRVFGELGGTAWSAHAAAELQASGEVRRAAEPATRDDLTPQERHIATMAADGRTNREIAQHLFLSPRTVGAHLSRIYPKLGITSRAQLAAALRQTG